MREWPLSCGPLHGKQALHHRVFVIAAACDRLQGRGIELGGRAGHHVGDQPLSTGADLPGHHRHVLHRGMPGERCLDFRQLEKS